MNSSTHLLYNRITGHLTKADAAVDVLGLYSLVQKARVNNIDWAAGDYLCPTSVGHVNINEQSILRLSIDQLPAEEEISALRAVTSGLESSWHYLAENSLPYFPATNTDILELKPIERLLKTHLVHIEAVNRHPRTHLQSEVERTSVAQARNVPTRAYQFLASHTEDWEYQRFSHVTPRRLLSAVSTDFYRFYENFVAAALTVHLYRDLSKRQNVLNDIFNVIHGDSTNLPGGSYRKVHRQAKLLGKLYQVSQDPEQVLSSLLKEVESMRRQIGALFNTTLLKQIPEAWHIHLPATLRMTNILTNDKHYRYVRLLWEKNQTRVVNKTPEQQQSELQELHHDHETFVVMLIVRALDALEIRPNDINTHLVRNSRIRLTHAKSSQIFVDLSYTQQGTIDIFVEDICIARFVPLIQALTQDAATALKHFESIDRLARDGEFVHLFIVYPSRAAERQQLSVEVQSIACDIGNMPTIQRRQKSERVGYIPVSPNELDSVERVGRALRWVVWKTLFTSYPFLIPVPRKYRKKLADQSSGLKILIGSSNKEEVHLVKLVADQQRAKLYKWMEEQQSTTSGKLVPAITIEEQHIFKVELENATKKLHALATCPLCGTDCVSKFESRDRYFICRCNSCNAEWGTHACGDCQKEIPFIKLDSDISEKIASHLADATYGMDILSIPSGSNHFICPSCGNSGN